MTDLKALAERLRRHVLSDNEVNRLADYLDQMAGTTEQIIAAWINDRGDVLLHHPEAYGREDEDWTPLYRSPPVAKMAEREPVAWLWGKNHEFAVTSPPNTWGLASDQEKANAIPLYAAPPEQRDDTALLRQALEALDLLRSGIIKMREHAESYGEAWARAYVKEYREMLPGSAEDQFRALNVMQHRLMDVAEGIVSGYDAIAALRARLDSAPQRSET